MKPLKCNISTYIGYASKTNVKILTLSWFYWVKSRRLGLMYTMYRMSRHFGGDVVLHSQDTIDKLLMKRTGLRHRLDRAVQT